jgi:hypothetical protein
MPELDELDRSATTARYYFAVIRAISLLSDDLLPTIFRLNF